MFGPPHHQHGPLSLPQGPMGPYNSMNHGHVQFQHVHPNGNHHNHGAYPTFYDQGPPRMMDVALQPPIDQNVNRWDALLHQQQQHSIVEMGGPSPRHQHFGRPNNASPPYPG